MSKANPEPFHAGEIAVQERTGERPFALRNGVMLRDTIAAPARPFLARQRALALATVDDDGQPWASFWLGPAGFARSEDGALVELARPSELCAAEDPVRRGLLPGRDVGLLAIELSSRRRLRINGVLGAVSDDAIEVVVRESFANCPKYIQRREPGAARGSFPARPVETGVELDAPRCALVERADTLFVASRHPTRGVDVSHRGGGTGFVRVSGARALRVPDYPGNSMFQTLGNFEIDARAGVVFVDFERARLLSLTGAVTVSYGADDPRQPSGGTGRYWQLQVTSWVELPLAGGFHWQLLDASPFNPPTCPV